MLRILENFYFPRKKGIVLKRRKADIVKSELRGEILPYTNLARSDFHLLTVQMLLT